MPLELANYYENAARKEHPYTHLLQAKIPSLGQRFGCRVPDLLLTMQYRLDAKGNVVVNPEPKLTFQPDGPSDAQLNFKHDTLRFNPKFSVCQFELSMDAVFGEGVVMKENVTLGGTVGMDKAVKSELQAGAEFGKESPGTRTHLHGRLYGMLTRACYALVGILSVAKKWSRRNEARYGTFSASVDLRYNWKKTEQQKKLPQLAGKCITGSSKRNLLEVWGELI